MQHYPKLMGLAKTLWQSSLFTFEKITETPLVTGLVRGLASEEFHRFTLQDIYYLERSFKPVMIVLCKKATDPSHKALFAEFISATEVELVQLKSQVSTCDKVSGKPSDVCAKYGQHLLNTVLTQSYSVGLAACLPCFLFFPAIGLHVKSKVEDLDNHPQSGWIKVYAEQLFDNAYLMATMVNEAVEAEEEDLALKVYTASAAFELGFFEDALALDEGLALEEVCSLSM